MRQNHGRSVLACVFSAWVVVMSWGIGWCEEPVKPPARATGYLSAGELPDSLTLIPPPPVQGSAALVSDEQASRKALSLRGTPSWVLAAEDADLAFPHVVNAFTCALSARITEQEMPRLYLLMRRAFTDAVMSTFAAKDKYARVRPFVVNKQPTCSPAEEARLAKNGSYPSGHAALGWTWALILAEIAPDRANEILLRGRAFAQGRTVCNVHWQSDVVEGMMVAAATVARLHGNPDFRTDLDVARAEVANARKKGPVPPVDCKVEAAVETIRVTHLP